LLKLILSPLVWRCRALTHNKVHKWMSMNLNWCQKPPLQRYLLSNLPFDIVVPLPTGFLWVHILMVKVCKNSSHRPPFKLALYFDFRLLASRGGLIVYFLPATFIPWPRGQSNMCRLVKTLNHKPNKQK
jgi:hypothetical protein